jgi:hypothetical protein
MEYGLTKKIAAWALANREPNKQEDEDSILHEAAQDFEVF